MVGFTRKNKSTRPLVGRPDTESLNVCVTVSLYGADPSQVRYAAERYAAESLRLLESLLPTTGASRSRRTISGVNVEEVTARAFAYAAESRRLLRTAENLEASPSSTMNSPPGYRPPLRNNSGNGGKFPYALNLTTEELSPRDAENAARFAYYAREAQSGNGNPEISRIMREILPGLGMTSAHVANKQGMTNVHLDKKQGVAKKPLFWALLVACALVGVLFVAGRSIRGRMNASQANSDVSESNAAYWNSETLAPTIDVAAASSTGQPTIEPTMRPTTAPTSFPTQSLSSTTASVPTIDTGTGTTISSSGSSGHLRHSSWLLGALAAVFLGFSVGISLVILRAIRRNSTSKKLEGGPEESFISKRTTTLGWPKETSFSRRGPVNLEDSTGVANPEVENTPYKESVDGAVLPKSIDRDGTVLNVNTVIVEELATDGDLVDVEEQLASDGKTNMTLPSGATLTANEQGQYTYNINGVHDSLGHKQTVEEFSPYTTSEADGGSCAPVNIQPSNSTPITIQLSSSSLSRPPAVHHQPQPDYSIRNIPRRVETAGGAAAGDNLDHHATIREAAAAASEAASAADRRRQERLSFLEGRPPRPGYPSEAAAAAAPATSALAGERLNEQDNKAGTFQT